MIFEIISGGEKTDWGEIPACYTGNTRKYHQIDVSVGPKGGLGGTCPPEEAVNALKKIHAKYDIATIYRNAYNSERLFI